MRDDRGIVVFNRGVKAWMAQMPSVEAARPGRCPACGVGSRPIGGALQVHGHGVRSRDWWGIASERGSPEVHELTLRRYRCVPCGAVITVGPRGLVHRHLYDLATIVVGLYLWSIGKVAAREVRARLSPWRLVGASSEGWRSLKRWARSLGWPRGGEVPAGSPRVQAERRAQAALAMAPAPRAGVAAVFHGVAQAG